MRVDAKKRTTCRLCESSQIKLVIPLEEIPLTEKYLDEEELGKAVKTFPIDVYMCLDCGHVQLLDVINPNTTSNFNVAATGL